MASIVRAVLSQQPQSSSSEPSSQWVDFIEFQHTGHMTQWVSPKPLVRLNLNILESHINYFNSLDIDVSLRGQCCQLGRGAEPLSAID